MASPAPICGAFVVVCATRGETEAQSQQMELSPAMWGSTGEASRVSQGQAGDGTGTLLASPHLFQFDLKEKKSFFGQRKDYWDFLCQGLAQRRQEHEGIRFVTSLDKVGMGQRRGLTGHPLGGHGHRRWTHGARAVLGVQAGVAVLHQPCSPPAEDPRGQGPCLPALLPGAPAAGRVPAALPARPREPQVRAWRARGWLCHCKARLPAL